MSCSRYEERIDELASGELAPESASKLRVHLDACPACARRFRETRATLSLLHRVGEERVPEELALSLRRCLAASPPPSRPGAAARFRAAIRDRVRLRPLAAGFIGAALAATLLVVVFANHQASHRPELAAVASGQVAPVFVVPKAKVALVRIDFHAEEALEDIEFAIRLPDGLHFVSQGRELPDREVRWRGRLERGSNSIPVTVRSRRAGRYTLTAHAVGDEVSARHDVILEVT